MAQGDRLGAAFLQRSKAPLKPGAALRLPLPVAVALRGAGRVEDEHIAAFLDHNSPDCLSQDLIAAWRIPLKDALTVGVALRQHRPPGGLSRLADGALDAHGRAGDRRAGGDGGDDEVGGVGGFEGGEGEVGDLQAHPRPGAALIEVAHTDEVGSRLVLAGDAGELVGDVESEGGAASALRQRQRHHLRDERRAHGLHGGGQLRHGGGALDVGLSGGLLTGAGRTGVLLDGHRAARREGPQSAIHRVDAVDAEVDLGDAAALERDALWSETLGDALASGQPEHAVESGEEQRQGALGGVLERTPAGVGQL